MHRRPRCPGTDDRARRAAVLSGTGQEGRRSQRVLGVGYRAVEQRARRTLLLDEPGRPTDFFAISTVTFLLWTGSSILIPVLPLYTDSLGLNYTETGIVIGAFYAGRLLFNLFGGRLADRRSLRVVAAWGCLVTAVASASAGVIESYLPLVASRFVQGAGAGLYLTAALAAVVRSAPPSLVGRYTSLYQGIGLLGFTFGPVIGGVLAQFAGLRAPFFGYAVAALIGVHIALRRLDRTVGAAGASPRPAATLEGPSIRRGPYRMAMLVALTIFWLRAGILNTLVPLLAAGQLGMIAGSIGLMFALSGVGNVAILGRAGRSLDRGRRPAVLWSTVGSGIFVISAGLAWTPSLLIVAVVLATTVTGYASVTPTVVIADSVSSAAQGRAIGMLRVITDLSLLVGPVISGLVADAFGLRAGIMSAGVATLLVAGIAATRLPETRPGSGVSERDEGAAA